MPKIGDQRIVHSKKKIRQCIRIDFAQYMNDGRTYSYAIGKLIDKYGYSESTIYQIVKKIGKYKD